MAEDWKIRREEQRQRMAEQRRKRMLKSILLWSALVVVVVIIAFLVYRQFTGPGKYDAFAQCMTANGMTMYGTDWCPHCQRQKQLFGNSFKYVNFVNCDLSKECDQAGVQSYPTWGKGGKLYEPGVKSLAELGELSGCQLS